MIPYPYVGDDGGGRTCRLRRVPSLAVDSAGAEVDMVDWNTYGQVVQIEQKITIEPKYLSVK